jgi:hypothetical protein
VKGSSNALGPRRCPILEDARRRESHALVHGELIAVRREQVEQRVLAGPRCPRRACPLPNAPGTRRTSIVERSLGRLAAVQENPAVDVVQLAVDGDLPLCAEFPCRRPFPSCRHATKAVGIRIGVDDPAMRDPHDPTWRCSGLSLGAVAGRPSLSITGTGRGGAAPCRAPRRRRAAAARPHWD